MTRRETLRRLVAGLAVLLFILAMFYPFRPGLEQGILGPVGQLLFFYLLMGWVFILLGVDPTGAGPVFSFFAPWPTLNILLAVVVLFRPRRRCKNWLRVGTGALAAFSLVAAWRLADAVSLVPLSLWSGACLAAALAISLPGNPQPPVLESTKGLKE